MRVLAGTSGYSYDEWKGCFYPDGLPVADRLAHYASCLPAVEINNTFYRVPKRSVVEGWAAQVPESFRFVLKASQRVTHRKRLRNAEEEVGFVLRQFDAMGERLGAILFQLPPNLRQDLPLLEAFLAHLPAGTRAAFEFRHPSWHDEGTYARLAERDLALVASEEQDGEAVLEPTASWTYLRLRREDYDDAALDRWARRLADGPWEEAFCFFKHEEAGAGPALAARFLERFRA